MSNTTAREREHLARMLADLEAARDRRRELSEALATVNASRFAKLRSFVRAARGLPLGATHVSSAVVASSPETDSLRSAYRRADTERAVLQDLLEQQRHLGDDANPYQRWLRANALRDADVARIARAAKALAYRPTFSILVATYDTEPAHLRAMIDSVLAQAYDRWELCVADDASTDANVRSILADYAAKDERIKTVFRPENGHISRATNSALELATGEFIGLLDHDDLLTPDALFENAVLLNHHPDADMIYSDEDKIDDDGVLSEPHFKPDWAPESILSRMYTCHFGVYRRSLAVEIGGFRAGYEGSQDHDFVLRLTERTDRVHHIPRVLYHWRIHAASTSASASSKPYASPAGIRAVEAALERRGEPGIVTSDPDFPSIYRVRLKIREAARVSIVVPTRDHGDDVDRCLSSIFSKSTYENFEVLLVDNGSTEPKSLETFRRMAREDHRVKLLPYPQPFNFSAINNMAARKASGKYLLFLNNDTEVISPDWIEAMIEQAQRPRIGVVGGLLLYPDDTIQHAGVVVGLGGVAGHGHRLLHRDHPGYFGMLRAINNFSALTAACIMIRQEVFCEVGMFDERLAVAFNDVDLCLRVRDSGYRNVYLPHVMLYHFESKSRGAETTPEKQARFKSEVDLMLSRWRTSETVDPYYNRNLTLQGHDYAIKA